MERFVMRIPAFVASVALTVTFSVPCSAQTAPPAGAPGQVTPLPPRDAPQAPKAGTAIIRGRVVRADTGAPLRRAQVQVSGSAENGLPKSVYTDDDGRYELTRLPAGRYTLQAERGGYVTLHYGQRRPFETPRPLTLAEGQLLEKMDFSLPRGGVVSGRVVDEVNEPVTGAGIQLWRYAYSDGRRRLMPTYGGTSDDRGEFRVFGLSPGDYYVSASLGREPGFSEDRLGYATTYYPGSLTPAEAQRVSIGLGEEIAGIGISLALAKRVSISGVVRTSDGRPLGFTMVATRPTSEDGAAMTTSPGFTLTKSDGSFTLDEVAPGTYAIEARSAFDPAEEFATAEVIVNSDVVGLSLVMSRGRTARGRIRFDEGEPPSNVRPGEIRVMAPSFREQSMSFSDGADRGRVRDDWTFELTGLSGQRLLRAFVLPPWTFKSVRLEGTDITDTPIDFRDDVEGLEVTLTRRVTDLSGRVTGDKDQPAADAVVVVFAADREKWGPQTRFVRSARPDQDGRFQIEALPPGSYLAVALDYLEPGEEGDPERLESLRPAATRVTLREGEKRTLDLKVTTF